MVTGQACVIGVRLSLSQNRFSGVIYLMGWAPSTESFFLLVLAIQILTLGSINLRLRKLCVRFIIIRSVEITSIKRQIHY